MRRAFKTARNGMFFSVAAALGLILVSSSAFADTCIFDPNESGAMVKQYGYVGSVMIELVDSDCSAVAYTPDTVSEAGLHAFLGHVLAAKAMNRQLEVEYTMGAGPILESLRMIEP
ncbi:hypothetical protein ACFL4G_10470 [Thermodesulfobacteriota bacterium]